MRGEYGPRGKPLCTPMELPPRARRIRDDLPLSYPPPGTTSACAENTVFGGVAERSQRNYLRVRGEYKPGVFLYARLMELPPRARRIHNDVFEPEIGFGTTSACAENTQWGRILPEHQGNYLRVRGEYRTRRLPRLRRRELPPRARRIQVVNLPTRANVGTTSACAENTACFSVMRAPTRNYLRVRGEYRL